MSILVEEKIFVLFTKFGIYIHDIYTGNKIKEINEPIIDFASLSGNQILMLYRDRIKICDTINFIYIFDFKHQYKKLCGFSVDVDYEFIILFVENKIIKINIKNSTKNAIEKIIGFHARVNNASFSKLKTDFTLRIENILVQRSAN